MRTKIATKALKQEGLVNIQQVLLTLGIGRKTLTKIITSGRFPPPIELGFRPNAGG
jgi:predicted DNA-binding transcriptional regulator AlpA